MHPIPLTPASEESFMLYNDEDEPAENRTVIVISNQLTPVK